MTINMQKLNQGFYNILSEALHLAQKPFQLIQGAQPLSSIETSYYKYLDATPGDQNVAN